MLISLHQNREHDITAKFDDFKRYNPNANRSEQLLRVQQWLEQDWQGALFHLYSLWPAVAV